MVGLQQDRSARRSINKPVLKIFDKTVWLWRRVDGLMPWPGAVADRGGAERRGSRWTPRTPPRPHASPAERVPAMRLKSTRRGLRPIVAAFSGKRILVIGDLMLDEFIWGKVSRISPEAPVPVVNVVGRIVLSRGRGECGAQRPRVHGRSRGDGARPARTRTATRLLELLAGVRHRYRRRAAGLRAHDDRQDPHHGPQSAGGAGGPRAQRAHLDGRRRGAPCGVSRTAHGRGWTRIIVADYGKGFLTQPLADSSCRTARRHGKVLAVDPHPHTSLCWRGATVIKPNRAEAFLAAGLPRRDPGPRSGRTSRCWKRAGGCCRPGRPRSLLDHARGARDAGAGRRRAAVPYARARAKKSSTFRARATRRSPSSRWRLRGRDSRRGGGTGECGERDRGGEGRARRRSRRRNSRRNWRGRRGNMCLCDRQSVTPW